MSYFGLIETTFEKADQATGPLSSLFNDSNKLSTLKYPLDLSSSDKAHYVVFYAKTQKNTKTTAPTLSTSGNISVNVENYAKETVSGLVNSAKNVTQNTVSSIYNTISSNVNDIWNSLTGDSPATKEFINNSVKQLTQVSGASFNFLRTAQTSDAIALYMPDTVMYTHNQHYDSLRLGDELAGKALAAGKSALDAYKGAGGDKNAQRHAAAESLTKSAVLSGVNMLGNAQGSTGRLLASSVLGVVSNPLLEMIYNCPEFRVFSFEFIFYPRSQKEAQMVQTIIKRFYYHQAPELVKETQGFLIPPSEWDIEFFYNGSVNPNIPTIASCVLESVHVNYAPMGFSAYEIPAATTPTIGGTGMPVAIHLNLSFRETTYLTKEDFSE